MNTAIVTGATGGLGRNLVARLLAEGWHVIACGRNRAIGAALGCEFHAFDLSDPIATQQYFQAADAVFHCAALSSPWGAAADFYRANVIATQNVIAAARTHGIGKLIHVSSPSIYFDYLDQHALPETHITRQFVNHYAYTKYLAEKHVQAACDLPSVIIRPRGIFGEYDTALMPRLLKIAAKGFLPLVQRHGKAAGAALIDVSYVQNVVDALLLAHQANVPHAMPFNITNGEPHTIARLYTHIAKSLKLNIRFKTLPYFLLDNAARLLESQSRLAARFSGSLKEPLITRYSIGAIAFDQTLNINRAQTLLGYTPKISIEQGLENYARRFAQNKP